MNESLHLADDSASTHVIAERLRTYLPPERYCPLKPTAKQLAFLLSGELEVFYGGAAYGGKSIALAMAALQYVHVPGYNALLLRQTYAEGDLPDAIANVVHSWLAQTDASWDGMSHTYRFPSTAQLTLGYLDNDDSAKRYDSAQFHFIGWDELTHFPERHYLYMFRRLRPNAIAPHIPTRMRSASNPGGIGHEWVKSRFVTPQLNGTPHPERRFIPATMKDNKHASVEAYEKSLAHTDAVSRAQLEAGSWDVKQRSQMFHREWFEIINPAAAPSVKSTRTVRVWDLAATEPTKKNKDPDFTAGVKVSRTRDGIYYIRHVIKVRVSPFNVQQLVKQTAAVDTTLVEVGIEKEPGSAGLTVLDEYRRVVLPQYVVHTCEPTGPKIIRAMVFSQHAEAGHVKVVAAPWNSEFFDDCETAFTSDEAHDDVVDAASHAFNLLSDSSAAAFSIFEDQLKKQANPEMEVNPEDNELVEQYEMALEEFRDMGKLPERPETLNGKAQTSVPVDVDAYFNLPSNTNGSKHIDTESPHYRG